jgi:alpha-glucosidase
LGTASTSVRRTVLGNNQYILGSLQESDIGLTTQLTLAGSACAFGLDISDLTIEVAYKAYIASGAF